MCLVDTPKTSAPTLPPETAAMKAPDGNAARTAAGRRMTDQMRGGAGTILTSGSGVTTTAPTEKKTLLGQ